MLTSPGDAALGVAGSSLTRNERDEDGGREEVQLTVVYPGNSKDGGRWGRWGGEAPLIVKTWETGNGMKR